MIDLKNGLAVHAVAGRRRQYAPISILPTAGDSIGLALRYRSLGLRRLYIADLDAIESREQQFKTIAEILSCGAGFQDVYLDIGWTGDEDAAACAAVSSLANDFSSLRIVAATESASSLESARTLSRLVPARRMILGLDYRGGQLISDVADEPTWLKVAAQLNVAGVLVLDLQSVGTSQGVVTSEICRRVKQTVPNASIFSGGGIRNAQDVTQLLEAGCVGCLVATALM